MAKIVNLTPHPLDIFDENGNKVKSIPSSGVLRLDEKVEQIGNLDGIPLVEKRFIIGNDVQVEKREETFYYVSVVVASAFPDRDDFITAGETVRDEDGRVIGVKSFARLAR